MLCYAFSTHSLSPFDCAQRVFFFFFLSFFFFIFCVFWLFVTIHFALLLFPTSIVCHIKILLARTHTHTIVAQTTTVENVVVSFIIYIFFFAFLFSSFGFRVCMCMHVCMCTLYALIPIVVFTCISKSQHSRIRLTF